MAHGESPAYAHATVPRGEPALFSSPRGDRYLWRDGAAALRGANGFSQEHGGAANSFFVTTGCSFSLSRDPLTSSTQQSTPRDAAR